MRKSTEAHLSDRRRSGRFPQLDTSEGLAFGSPICSAARTIRDATSASPAVVRGYLSDATGEKAKTRNDGSSLVGSVGSNLGVSAADAEALAPLLRRALVPAVERRVVARFPRVTQLGRSEVPVGMDLAEDLAQIAPQVIEGRPPPKPVAVVDAVDHEPGLQYERVGNHRVVYGVGVLLD